MSHKKIADVLGIAPETSSSEEETELLEAEEVEEEDVISQMIPTPVTIGHVEEDYNYTRNRIKEAIDTGFNVLKGATEMASEGGKARDYEVVSNMLKNLADMSGQFFELQKKNKDIQQTDMSGLASKGVHIDRGIVFSGDSAAVLRHLKEKKKNE